MQAYSDPKRESEPTALPDIEVWHHETFEGDNPQECPRALYEPEEAAGEGHVHGPDCDGWYWQSCSPGCLPDGDPAGPFETEAEALADAREGMDDADTGDGFPEDTATVWDARGFPHVGHLTEQRDEQNGTALYYFPGDFIAGDGFDLWLDPVTAADAELLADYQTCEDEEWTAQPPEGMED